MQGLVPPGARLIDGHSGRVLSGDTLEAELGRVAAAYEPLPAGPLFCAVGRNLTAVLSYLSAVRAGRPVLPLDPALSPQALAALVARFAPAAVVGVASPAPPGYTVRESPEAGPVWVRHADPGRAHHPDLGLLLLTSGSTGTPKLVRLSGAGVTANARAVAAALAIDERTVAVTSLPLFYSFGLSVLHSHLLAGAAVVVTEGGVTDREFWQAVTTHRVTSLAAVPHHLEMLDRMRWTPDRHPALRVMATSGGSVRPELTTRLHHDLARQGGRFYAMYGQTEAGPRICVLASDLLPSKAGAVGRPVAGTRISLRDADGRESAAPGDDGEVICHGPSVMMGYADDAAGLAAGDDQGGRLATGDLGHLDEDGHLWLRARINRIGKVFGVRVHLDSVERALADFGAVAAIAAGDGIRVFHTDPRPTARSVAQRVADSLAVHPSGVDVRVLDALPVLANGKTDYHRLAS